MWIRCPNGVDTLVLDEAHITRLISEGGVEVPDPTLPTVEVATEPIDVTVEAVIESADASVDVVSEPDSVVTDGVVRKRGRQANR